VPACGSQRRVYLVVDALLPCPIVMACDDVVAADMSALLTGTNSNITATDQIRPIATTTAIPIHLHIAILHCRASAHMPLLGQYAFPHVRQSLKKVFPELISVGVPL
jgi:hypothetical protein